MPQKQLQEKMLQYQTLEETLKQLNERRELFGNRLMEIDQTKQAIQEVEKSKEDDVFVPLGSSVFLPGKLNKKEKMIVGLGADVALEKDPDEVRKILDERKKILEKGIEDLQNKMIEVVGQIRELEPEIQKLLSESQLKTG